MCSSVRPLGSLLTFSLLALAACQGQGTSNASSPEVAEPQNVPAPPTPQGDGQTNPTVTGNVVFTPDGSEYDTAIQWTHDAASGTAAGNKYDIRVYEATAFDEKKPLASNLTQLASYLDKDGGTDFSPEPDLTGHVPPNGKYYYLMIDTLEYAVASGKDALKGRHVFIRVYTKGALGWTTNDATDMSKSVIQIP